MSTKIRSLHYDNMLNQALADIESQVDAEVKLQIIAVIAKGIADGSKKVSTKGLIKLNDRTLDAI